MSPMPVSTRTRDPNKVKSRLEAVHRELQPTTIVYRGQPHESVLQIWRYVFPSAKMLVCLEDSVPPISEGAKYLPSNRSTSLVSWWENGQAFMNAFLNDHAPSLSSPERPITLRYRRYTSAPKAWASSRHYTLRGVIDAKRAVVEHEVLRSDGNFAQRQIISECVSPQIYYPSILKAHVLTESILYSGAFDPQSRIQIRKSTPRLLLFHRSPTRGVFLRIR